jgi:hypothetical protein
VRQQLAAISRYHLDAGLPDPCDDRTVRELRTAYDKQHAQMRRLAPPDELPPNFVAALDSRAVSPVLALAALASLAPRRARELAGVVVGFLFMLRTSTIVCMRVRDFDFFAHGVFRFLVAWEKTRGGMEPRCVHVTFDPSSPPPWMRLLRRALKCARRAGDDLLFPASAADPTAVWPVAALRPAQSGPEAMQHVQLVSASTERRRNAIKRTVTDVVRSLVAAVAAEHRDLPPLKQFSCKSLRPGGATAAAMLGFPMSEIQRVGHWKAQETVDRYVRQGLRVPDSVVADALASVLQSAAR